MTDLTHIEALLTRVPEGTTPGPWGFRDHWSDEAKAEVYPYCWDEGPGDAADLAEVRGGGETDAEERATAFANAALISLAPDLADALRTALATISDLTRERDAAKEALQGAVSAEAVRAEIAWHQAKHEKLCNEADAAEEAGDAEEGAYLGGQALTHRDDIVRLTALLQPAQEPK